MPSHPSTYDKTIVSWLFVMMGLVVGIIVLGGATRLTNSGLSITEWKPVTGALWPSSDAQWAIEFEKYKQTTEYAAEHPDMKLSGFKFIYFMEWIHRQLGRLIGIAYLFPLIYFAVKRRIAHDKFAFYGILGLICLQGAIGWWMVSSGFHGERIDVAPYRLATHLGMAFLILGLLLWLTLREISLQTRQYRVSKLAGLFTGLVFLQIISGAFVAGNHAGKIYTDWPLMGGKVIPENYMSHSDSFNANGAAHPLIEGLATTQFNHRVLAYILVLLIIAVFVRYRKNHKSRTAVTVLAITIIWQVGLGIVALMHAAPFNLSILHQTSSIAVFLAAVFMAWTTRLTPSQT